MTYNCRAFFVFLLFPIGLAVIFFGSVLASQHEMCEDLNKQNVKTEWNVVKGGCLVADKNGNMVPLMKQK